MHGLYSIDFTWEFTGLLSLVLKILTDVLLFSISTIIMTINYRQACGGGAN